MASFPPVTMTTEGLNMIAKASSGNTEDRLIITKVKLGDGVSEGNIRDYTDVISSKKEVSLSKWEDRGDGRFRYTFIYNNEGVKTGFYHREIGLFAKNGDSGTEKLIAYSNAGSYPGYIDDETKEIPYQRLMINIGVGDTDNVSGRVDVSNAVTIEMLNEHDADENAHSNLIKRLFGSASATMESVKQKNEEWAKEVCLPLSGGTLTGNLNANGHNVTATKFIGNLEGNAKNINYGYNAGETPLPTENFRTNVLNLNGMGFSVQPTHCASVDKSTLNCVGIAFSGGWDTNGFIQISYYSPRAWIGGGSDENIRWYKELAFKDDVINVSSVKPMMLMTLDNSIVGTGWTKNIDGVITQIAEIDLNGQQEIDILFPITFPQKCLFLDIEIINVEKDTNINCIFHTIEKTVDGAKLLKVGTGSPKKIVVKVVGI
jgi:hypothetical protein|nr:MAG TPA: tail-collar fiber protein [Caudoviricetes sp.]